MKLSNEIEITDFLAAVKAAKGEVWLESVQGDVYNLKSVLSRYVALGALIENHGADLELFCGSKDDEPLFFKFFAQHPETI